MRKRVRRVSPYGEITSGLRQQGCSLCGRVVDPERAYEHPKLGTIHNTCRNLLKWDDVGATSPNLYDEGDFGGGYAQWDEYEEK